MYNSLYISRTVKVSLVMQPTIECLGYLKFRFRFQSINLWFFDIHFMQVFSADIIILKKYIKKLKSCPQK
jgi:hypothetical protein